MGGNGGSSHLGTASPHKEDTIERKGQNDRLTMKRC